jgi:hypothetical protein
VLASFLAGAASGMRDVHLEAEKDERAFSDKNEKRLR